LEIDERIGNVQGKAATLKQLGIIYANKGEVDEAIALFNQSLEISERIGDVQTKAATLQWLGYLRQQRGCGVSDRTFQVVFGNKQCGILINEPIFYVYTIKIFKICN